MKLEDMPENPSDEEVREILDSPGTMIAIADAEGETILRYFEFAHLPPKLATVSRLFAALALAIIGRTPRCAERTAGLRKLLEAKDCAVRAGVEAPKTSIVSTAPAGTPAPSGRTS